MVTVTNPIFKTKVLTWEQLAYGTKDVWFRQYRFFDGHEDLEKEASELNESAINIRNAEVYEVVIDVSKHGQQYFPFRNCEACGCEIEGDRHALFVEGKLYCSYQCYCDYYWEH